MEFNKAPAMPIPGPDLGLETEDMDEEDAPVYVPPDRSGARAKDMDLYHTWSQTQSKTDLGNLVHHLTPLIYTEVSRASGTLPTAALAGEAKIWAAKAIKSFDPSKGFALSTHVASYIRKVRRMNYKYQNVVRPPENMRTEFRHYSKAVTNLSDELNREPTEDEIARNLGWTKGKVVKFRDRTFKDLIESGNEKPTEVTQFSDRKLLIETLLDRLTPDERFLIEKKDELSSPEMAKALNVNINRLNYLQKKLKTKLEDIKLELGL